MVLQNISCYIKQHNKEKAMKATKWMVFLSAAILVIGVAITGCSEDDSPSAPKTGTITGTVQSSEGGDLDATVRCGTASVTASGGSYTLSGIDEGSQSVTASMSGYNSKSQTVTVIGNGSVTANFTLTKRTPQTPPVVGKWELELTKIGGPNGDPAIADDEEFEFQEDGHGFYWTEEFGEDFRASIKWSIDGDYIDIEFTNFDMDKWEAKILTVDERKLEIQYTGELADAPGVPVDLYKKYNKMAEE